MTEISVTSSGKFRLAGNSTAGDYSVAMDQEKKHDAAQALLFQTAKAKGLSFNYLSRAIGKDRGYIENYLRKGSPRVLKYEHRVILARLLGPGITPEQLAVVIHRGRPPKEDVASNHQIGLAFGGGSKRTGNLYQNLPELVHVIGTVQAGAWMEAYQLPEGEWMEMRLSADPRYPGIPRYGLLNAGNSMNRVCRDGGTWVFVFFRDLHGQGPSVGQYVIVERRRKDGMVEATAKQFRLGPDGQPWLYPDSDDPSFEPFPLTGGDEIEEIRVIGRVVEVVNRV